VFTEVDAGAPTLPSSDIHTCSDVHSLSTFSQAVAVGIILNRRTVTPSIFHPPLMPATPSICETSQNAITLTFHTNTSPSHSSTHNPTPTSRGTLPNPSDPSSNPDPLATRPLAAQSSHPFLPPHYHRPQIPSQAPLPQP